MKDKNIPAAGESILFNETVTDYIISLTHLYELVRKDKVVEIFNLQNNEKINIEFINRTWRNMEGRTYCVVWVRYRDVRCRVMFLLVDI